MLFQVNVSGTCLPITFPKSKTVSGFCFDSIWQPTQRNNNNILKYTFIISLHILHVQTTRIVFLNQKVTLSILKYTLFIVHIVIILQVFTEKIFFYYFSFHPKNQHNSGKHPYITPGTGNRGTRQTLKHSFSRCKAMG